MHTKVNKGFTLLEILLVIAAIGILAAIVLVAINPTRQIAQVRDAQRRSDINTIYKALEQYLIDNQAYPAGITEASQAICNNTVTTSCVDLGVLIPTYLASIPKDPSGEVYRVYINPENNRIGVEAPGVELGQSLAVNLLTTPIVTDADALSYITAVELADGQALEDNVKTAINTFVVGLKTDGLWDAMKSSVIMAGARTLNGALVPLKGAAPTNVNFVSLDYDRKTGLVGDGQTKYLETARLVNDDPQNDNHVAVYATTLGNQNFWGNPGVARHDATATVGRNRYSGGGGGQWPSSITNTGLIGLSRDNQNTTSSRINQTTGSITQGAGVPPAEALRFFRSGQGVYGTSRFAFYSIGESLDLALLDARVTTLINTYANAIPDPPIVQDGLVLHLDAGDPASYPGTGTIWTDLSGNGNNGTLVNGVGFDSGNGGALSFDGANDYVNLSFVNPFAETVIVWARSTTTTWNTYGWLSSARSQNGHIIHPELGAREVTYYMGNSAGLGFDGEIGKYTPGDITIPHMYAYSTNGTNIHKGYFDGTEVVSKTNSMTRTASPTAQTYYIGADLGVGARYGNGNIYVVLRYNRALTAEEIQQNFDATKGRFGL